MWPFSRKVTLEDSGLLQGFTEWHCHLLPGVDDGVQTMEDSLDILSEYERLGVKEVWLTPHIMEDTPNKPADLREKFAQLKEKYTGNIVLHLAAENMLDNIYNMRLEANDVLPLGTRGDMLLLETSYFTPPTGMEDMLQRTKSAGYFPLLAHPERYFYMGPEDYESLKRQDVKFQLNIYSLFGMYGPQAANRARQLLKQGMYDAVGTDTHKLRQLKAALRTHALSKKEVIAIKEIIDGFQA